MCHECVMNWFKVRTSLAQDQMYLTEFQGLTLSTPSLVKLTSRGSRRRLAVCLMLSLELGHVYGFAVTLYIFLPSCHYEVCCHPVSFLGWLYFLRQGSRHGNKGKMPLLFWVGNHSIWGMSDQRMRSSPSNLIQISIQPSDSFIRAASHGVS